MAVEPMVVWALKALFVCCVAAPLGLAALRSDFARCGVRWVPALLLAGLGALANPTEVFLTQVDLGITRAICGASGARASARAGAATRDAPPAPGQSSPAR